MLLVDRGVLPISGAVHSVAVIGTQAGPNANTARGPVSSREPAGGQRRLGVCRSDQRVHRHRHGSGVRILERAERNRRSRGLWPDGHLLARLGGADRAAGCSRATAPRAARVRSSHRAPTLNPASWPPTTAATTRPTRRRRSAPRSCRRSTTTGPGARRGSRPSPAVPGGSPAVSIPSQYQWDNWSSSYQAVYTPAATGDYNFSVVESGTTKLYVAGQLVSDGCATTSATSTTPRSTLTAGQPSRSPSTTPRRRASPAFPRRSTYSTSTRSSATRCTWAWPFRRPADRAWSSRRRPRRPRPTWRWCSPAVRSARDTTSRAFRCPAIRTR